MTPTEHTCWTVIQGAASGNTEDRELFAEEYTPVAKSYFEARWASSPLADQIDDGVQEVFLECFKENGVLDRLEDIRHGSFRRFLYGVVRNVALRIESKKARSRENQAAADFDFNELERDEETLSKIFDRAWARIVLKNAVAIQLAQARTEGEAAKRRVELLHLRFYEGLPIREIARSWDTDARALYREYARAQEEFKDALLEVVEFHNPASPGDAAQEVEEIISILAD